MPDIHTYKIERLKVIGGLTHKQQRFFIRPGSRSRPWKFFDGWEVPEFEGDHAWFEIERSRGAWIFRRRVEDRP
ncbi:hypothetical protein [uncultured Phenylobacterium sp.]|uniref:hypothetical protein n=1 Tax=uncultured Phenylobacterium sp. TaxID=349273 RepID=UPI0025F9551A|nr:hypothetical protein [uncultured Phenylobacterium sp.]